MTEIHGYCEDGFEALQAQFAANFDEGLERGASVAVTLHGKTVVDLWAGDADGTGRPWVEDTIVNVWSTTKTMSAICVLMLADRGELDLDAPIATYWPEFAVNGKASITAAHVLGHTAGLSGWDPAIEPADLYDWDKAVGVLAAQAPWWEPGTASGYHAITQGYLEGEIVRRITGQTIGGFFRDQVARPLGADFHIGLPESEEYRVGEMVVPTTGLLGDNDLDPASIAARSGMSAPISGRECNTREWRAAELPAVGGTGNARSVARVHSALANGGTVDGVTLLSPAGVERILVEQAHSEDLVLGMKMRMGTGFGLISESVPLSPNPRAFWWGGWGGSIALTDLDAGMSVAYVMNKMAGGMSDLRGALILFAAYDGLANQC